MVVPKFIGENGLDHGSPRLELLSILFDSIESTIDAVNEKFLKLKNQDLFETLNPIGISDKELSAQKFASGIWAGNLSFNILTSWLTYLSI